MDSIRTRLEAQAQEIQIELARLNDLLRERGDYGFGKGDPAVYQWEFNLALRERYEQRLEQIEKALGRLDGGLYGTCEQCGRQIEAERLDAVPYTTLCITCARKQV
jgi:RNA polymerase-binding protein DksA